MCDISKLPNNQPCVVLLDKENETPLLVAEQTASLKKLYKKNYGKELLRETKFVEANFVVVEKIKVEDRGIHSLLDYPGTARRYLRLGT